MHHNTNLLQSSIFWHRGPRSTFWLVPETSCEGSTCSPGWPTLSIATHPASPSFFSLSLFLSEIFMHKIKNVLKNYRKISEGDILAVQCAMVGVFL